MLRWQKRTLQKATMSAQLTLLPLLLILRHWITEANDQSAQKLCLHLYVRQQDMLMSWTNVPCAFSGKAHASRSNGLLSACTKEIEGVLAVMEMLLMGGMEA